MYSRFIFGYPARVRMTPGWACHEKSDDNAFRFDRVIHPCQLDTDKHTGK